MTTFVPRNRYLRIQRRPTTEETVENLGLVLPEGYETPKSTHEVVEIIELSPDTKPSFQRGQKALVLSQMIEDIEAEGEVISLILENHIVGILGT